MPWRREVSARVAAEVAAIPAANGRSYEGLRRHLEDDFTLNQAR